LRPSIFGKFINLSSSNKYSNSGFMSFLLSKQYDEVKTIYYLF